MSEEKPLPEFRRIVTPQPFEREEMLMSRHEDDDGNLYYIRADTGHLRAVLEALPAEDRAKVVPSCFGADLKAVADSLHTQLSAAEARAADAERENEALEALRVEQNRGLISANGALSEKLLDAERERDELRAELISALDTYTKERAAIKRACGGEASWTALDCAVRAADERDELRERVNYWENAWTEDNKVRDELRESVDFWKRQWELADDDCKTLRERNRKLETVRKAATEFLAGPPNDLRRHGELRVAVRTVDADPQPEKPKRCPRCDSPAPHLHPAVQSGGEVSPCCDQFHQRVTPENTPEKIAEAAAYTSIAAMHPFLVIARAAHTAAEAVDGPARAAMEVLEAELLRAVDDAG